MPDHLQQAMLPVVEHSVCSCSNWWAGNSKTTMIYAGGDAKSGCNGDSAGPLSCQGADGGWYVHGVTSFVSSVVCNEAQKPTVFTRTSAFIDWISKNVPPPFNLPPACQRFKQV
ncbi:Chymotrypsin-like elastase family member 3B [Merluccius polli]|uniref:Chymotrypsin-like elastase family member 3B n=1 Tax=Merluccius polli TaxID=89951 RepID=A0AA47NYQ6_MERPO|nr:Chymotrypsin-like elastase family member 3B [Merluccius polli]